MILVLIQAPIVNSQGQDSHGLKDLEAFVCIPSSRFAAASTELEVWQQDGKKCLLGPVFNTRIPTINPKPETLVVQGPAMQANSQLSRLC